MGLELPPGSSFRSHLRSLDQRAGVLLQARHSLRLVAQMVAVAEDCADLPQHCTNLWLGAFSSDFDRAVRALLRGLGLVNESNKNQKVRLSFLSVRRSSLSGQNRKSIKDL